MSLLGVLARALVGCPPPHPPAEIPAANQLETMEGSEARRNAALKMLDDDCHGFLLLTVHRRGAHGHVELAHQIQPGWWPAVVRTLERVIAATRVP